MSVEKYWKMTQAEIMQKTGLIMNENFPSIVG